MTRQPAQHNHDQDHGGGVDLWRWLDVAVITAIVVIVVLASEWFVGTLIRERLARQADRYLSKVNASKGTESPPGE